MTIAEELRIAARYPRHVLSERAWRVFDGAFVLSEAIEAAEALGL